MARKRKKATTKTGPKKQLATIRRDQKRPSILTQELHDVVSEDVREPTKVLYPWDAQGPIRTLVRSPC